MPLPVSRVARWPRSATVAATLLVALAGPTSAAPQTAAQPSAECTLQYERADNMWAAEGRPDGALGKELVTWGTVRSSVDFLTDWRYERLRNDGRIYYGSHLRIATNVGARQIRLTLVLPGLRLSDVSLEPGATQTFKADLRVAYCG